jgi:hypothetical protein
VLKLCIRADKECTEDRQDCTLDDLSTDFVEWESTDLQAVIKASEWSKIHGLRGRHLEDPIKEISAMQLLGNYHTNVLGAVEVLQDDEYLYTVMPHVSGGDLYGRLLDGFPPQKHKSENPGDKSYGFDESQARIWFRQLLLVSKSDSGSPNLFHFVTAPNNRFPHLCSRRSFTSKRKVYFTGISPLRIFCLMRRTKSF